jgi:hypothetical protein
VKMPSALTSERLREVLGYDPDTGLFTRRLARSGFQVGAVAGCLDGYGYTAIKIDGRLYAGHRLAWFWVHGIWPANNIDHINGDRADNRIHNLRDVPTSTNCQNQRRAQFHNKTGFLGVSPNRGRFRAAIWLGGKYLHIGVFDTPEQAHEAYLTAKRRLHDGCTI